MTRNMLANIHGAPVPGAPRWARWCAGAITFLVLPSCLWRILAFIVGVPLMTSDKPAEPFGSLWWYVIGLSLVSEVAAFAAFALVAQWGEIWPRWVPRLQGRRIPIMAVVIPASIGSVIVLYPPLTYVLEIAGVGAFDSGGGAADEGWRAVVFRLAYLPLVAWGPLMMALTLHYYRRRTGRSQTQLASLVTQNG